MDPDAIIAAIEQQRDTAAEPQAEQERVSYLGFYLGDEVYGLPLEQLREVAHVGHLRRVPGAPAGVAGLVNLRGEILCALDVRAILGFPPKASSDTPFIVALGPRCITGLLSNMTSTCFSNPYASGLVLSTATRRIDPGM